MSTVEFWQHRFLFHFTQNITHWQIKIKKSGLQFSSASRWTRNVLHFVVCSQLNVSPEAKFWSALKPHCILLESTAGIPSFSVFPRHLIFPSNSDTR